MKMKRYTFILVMLMISMMMMAVPAKRGLTRMITLSDGSTVEARLVGDEFGHFWLTDNGRAYVKTTDADYFTEVNAVSIKEQAMARRSQVNAQRIQRLPGTKMQAASRRVGDFGNYIGARKALVILVNFSDVNFAEGHDNALFQRIANEVGFNEGNFVGSMYDYFYAQSEGQFELTFDVLGPVTVSKTQSYYGGNDSSGNDLHPEEMVKEAVEQIMDQVTDWKQYDWDNDGYVDQVYVIYAGNGEADGGGATTIWPHAWTLDYSGIGAVTVDENLKVNTYACGCELNGSNNINGIGTMCHEFSHCLGYPDFYDTDYSGGQGMSDWDLMDSGSYNGNGYRPAGYTGYERWMAGWKEPVELNTGKATVENMKGLQDGGEFYIMYNDGHKDEYFMLENRTKSGWDKSLPGSGLLIIHVDYDATIWAWNQPNDDPNHQRMTWIPSDGSYNFTGYGGNKYPTGLSKDPYPNATSGNNTFDDTSSPAANLYNNNTDGTKLLHKGIKDITKNSDGTISFNYFGPSTIETPVFSQNGGVIVEPVLLTITCATPSTTIYYTTDGTEPTTASNVYTEPLTINASVTIKAMAANSEDESYVATATFNYALVTPTANTVDYAWKEDFMGAMAGTSAENLSNENAAYECDGGEYCQVYDDNQAGGNAPELQIPNHNSPVNTLKTYIAIGDAFGEFTLTFKSNRSLSVSSTTKGVTIVSQGNSGNTYTYKVNIPENTAVLQLSFTNDNYQDARIDDIILAKPPKADPEIKFSSPVLTVNPTDEEYTAPTLDNPYHFPVTYTSSNTDIAIVDALTGELTLTLIEGEATITATFEGDDDYAASVASYTVYVRRDEPDLHFVERIFTVKAKSSFTPPELINEYNVPIYYETYDPEVADVDPKTGAVKIGKAGYTRIFANFDGNERYTEDWCSYEITVEKLEHGLAFDKTEVEATIGDDEGFTAPKLKNPNKLTVNYSSSDEDIATVDNTGKIILGSKAGTVTITASTEGDDYYEAGEASCQIILSEATGISTLSHDQQNTDTNYTIQGVRVNKPRKGLYILNGKKVIISR